MITGMTDETQPIDDEKDVPVLDSKYDPNLLDQLYTFPCAYTIKVIGVADGQLEAQVREIFDRHGQDAGTTYDVRPSAAGNYATVTAQFEASSREQIEALYSELKQLPQVKFLL